MTFSENRYAVFGIMLKAAPKRDEARRHAARPSRLDGVLMHDRGRFAVASLRHLVPVSCWWYQLAAGN